MPIALFRIDDRLIHGQVVVGWGQPLELGFIVLVDDDVANSEWEQELYRMGVPPEMSVHFLTVDDVVQRLAEFERLPSPGILLVGNIGTMQRLVTATHGQVRSVNVGGVHHAPGRTGRLRYVFLTPAEEDGLKNMAAQGVDVTAQDVPGARPVPLAELLTSSSAA
ncbi:PTS system mannose/fructose/N-acetylgalactosamine-transporter subunit IIB [Gemmatimonas sp.]|uniref:PTS system mannose/fructose/N-acetylgalactosamine-transporter subunit IIB n=1 Tax=Gemmatimonas sp. TaxID=1962908 RepID=UPI003F6F4408